MTTFLGLGVVVSKLKISADSLSHGASRGGELLLLMGSGSLLLATSATS